MTSPVETVSRPRGANAARRAATRDKLLKAAVKSLAKHGYHATSTVMVAECAGVSRGAMLHQFPTKLDLMLATAEYISLSFGAERRPRLTAIEGDRERLEVLIEIMWDEARSPAGIALLEIMMATRNDSELAARLAVQREAIDHTRSENLWRTAQKLGIKDRAIVEAMVTLDAAALRGLAVSALFMGPPETIEAGFSLFKRYRGLMLDSVLAKGAKKG